MALRGGRVADEPNPYGDLPPTAYWRSGVAEAGIFGLSGLWRSAWALPSDARFATFGSCFAQHISRALVARGMPWVDAEPAPGRCPPDLARRFGFGVFSARTGNIYTAAQLLCHARLATGMDDPDAIETWEQGGRHHDSLRPAIEPGGFASLAEAQLSRRSMVRGFARAVRQADVLVFTLGLTEGWRSVDTGQPYAMCPGTTAGRFDPGAHRFENAGYPEVRAALEEAIGILRGLNPRLRVLLTVSPVPLTATGSGQHVLVATGWSKATLRAVAGDLAASDAGIDYFPSFEIITGAPARAMFFDPNLRTVAPAGVDLVMRHFFAGLDLSAPSAHGDPVPDTARLAEAAMAAGDLVCEEEILGTRAGGLDRG